MHLLATLLTMTLLLPVAALAGPYPESGGAKTIDELVAMYDDSACRTCHTKEYDEWKGTPHADPINLSLGGLRNFLEIGVKKEWNRKVTKNEVMKCLDCHSPVIRFASEDLAVKIADMIVKANDSKDPAEKEAVKKELVKLNVNCVSCHNLKATTIALGIRGEPKKGAVYGVYGKKSPAHETVKSAELKTSLFCMQCHGVYDAPDGESIQCNTLSESYQANYVSRGGSRTCQDCHMKDKNRGHRMLGGRDLELVKEGIGFNVEVTSYRHLPKAPDTRWTPSAIVTVELTNNAGHRIPDG